MQRVFNDPGKDTWRSAGWKTHMIMPPVEVTGKSDDLPSPVNARDSRNARWVAFVPVTVKRIRSADGISC